MPPGTALSRINALIDQGQFAQAEAALKRALATDRKSLDLIGGMCFVLTRQGKLPQAEFYARELLSLLPTHPQALHNLGNILVTQGKYDEGVPILEHALALNPAEVQTRQAHSMGLIGMHRYASGARTLEEGLKHTPDDPGLLNNYAHCLHSIGRVEEALPTLRRAAALQPENIGIAEHLCAMISYCPGLSEQEVFDAHVNYGRLLQAQHPQTYHWTREALECRRKAGEPIRIGLISPDLRNHAVSFLIEALLEYGDRAKVFVACYSSCSHEDEVSERLKKTAGLWRRVYATTVEQAAQMIERDRIDVLIDLAGHTNGNRINVMALKPAPVQMTYMGFPNSTGCFAVDYRVVDSITDPPGDESLAVEKLLRLDPCFLSYRPPRELPPVNVRPPGDITFAAFSGVLKFNTPMLQLWAKVLKAVPSSRLLLKHHAFKEQEVRDDVQARLVSSGVEGHRIQITPPEPSAREVLPWYHQVDIALDTSPYNGTTTFCESFLMGIPMVSLNGRTPPARVGRSLLTAVNLRDLSADTEADFVRIAAQLASDRARLTQVRATLRDTFLNSSICDGPGFARRMTQACVWAVDQKLSAEG